MLLGVGVLVAGVPWRTHRRRRKRVSVDRTIQAWPNITESIGPAGSRVLSAVVDLWGWRARLSLRAGQTLRTSWRTCLRSNQGSVLDGSGARRAQSGRIQAGS